MKHRRITLPFTTEWFNHLGQRLAYSYVRHFMRSDIEWAADVPTGAKIIAANHPTTTDPFVMMAWPLEPIHILITEQAFKVPAVAQFLHAAGHIPVRAGRGHEAFNTALNLLQKGKTIGIFPEGALSDEDGDIGEGRTGAVRLAMEANVPIVPVGVALDWHFVRRHQIRQFGVLETMRWFWLGAYESTVGEAIYFPNTRSYQESLPYATALVMQRIHELAQRSAQRLLNGSWRLTAPAIPVTQLPMRTPVGAS